MKTQIQSLLLTTAMLVVAVSPLRAQLVADGATATINATTNTITGGLTIGTNGSFTTLIITNTGAVTNTTTGIIGSASTARTNRVIVTGTNSLWGNGGTLVVGSSGSFNLLLLTNGGKAVSAFGNIGSNAGSSNNVALVTDSGSVWTSAMDLYVGRFGSGNQLVVSNGGRVLNNDGYFSLSSALGNNLALVTGSGSVWSNAGILFLGESGAGNRLVVSNGGAVRDSYGYFGLNTSSSNNVALVTDSGSAWTNALDLYVGYSSAGNQLVVSNGATLSVGGSGFVGANSGANSNSVTVTGSGSVWSNADSLYVGYAGSANRMVISNGGVAQCIFGELGDLTGSDSNVVQITDAGSIWKSSILYVGLHGRGNRLFVTNGGFVSSELSSIGNQVSATGNEVMVAGAGSVWSNRLVEVGSLGSGNQLTITNGGTVLVEDTNTTVASLVIGASLTATNSRVTVNGGTLRVIGTNGTGPLDVRRGTNLLSAGLIDVDQLLLTNALGFFEFKGGTLVTRGAVISNGVPFVVGNSGATPAVWDVRAGANAHALITLLVVGQFAPFNQLLVTNGALLANAGSAFIGNGGSARSNAAVIAGPGSRLALGLDLHVGEGGTFNSLVVSNGGTMSDGNGFLGYSSSSNTALVTGAGSVWSNASALTAGVSGSASHLIVSNGASALAASGTVGDSSGNNQAIVTDSNSVWSTTLDLVIGRFGPGNQMIVSNGALVANSNAIIGFSVLSSNNLTLVTGAGSLWTNRFELRVGENGSGNQLVVTNGGAAVTVLGNVGFNAGSSNNAALVTGSGSVWSTSELDVGAFGSSNRLVVSSGGRVDNDYGYIGASGHSNEVIVTDAGSLWSNRFDLAVGFFGDANRLVVSNGGVVANDNGHLGYFASANNNVAVVTGAGSVWSNRLDLNVGLDGAGNRLVVSNGATVLVGTNALIGRNSGANSNSIVLSDAGTSLLIASTLYVGSNGAFNRLVISNGALVQSFGGFIGSFGSGGTNEAIVTGPDSRWRILDNGSLFIGDGFNSANRLVISNGGSMSDLSGYVGFAASNCEAIVTGPASVWSNRFELTVGNLLPANRLVVSNGGLVVVSDLLTIGALTPSLNNRVVVDGGTLRVSNNLVTGALDVRRGTNVLNAGLIEVDRLLTTNALGFFQFNGGTISTRKSTVSNGQLFRVGNGVSPATFAMAGNGTHSFSNGLTISANASLIGNGTITGVLTVQTGGAFAPGTSVGKVVLSNSPSLQGATAMEISKNGVALTNDQIQVNGALTCGGSLIVSNIGPTALASGDSFRLFVASNYAGSFSSLSLPALPPGLGWQDNLLVDGSLAVSSQIVVTSNATVRVMAANLTSGNSQRYETPGLNIMQGLAPDIVAIQEFNVSNSFGINTAAAVSNMVATTFGPSYSYFRETNAGYSIPNGVISRYPILASGSWIDSDTGVNDRGFARARIDLPGTNDLYAVSVHLKASSGTTNEARRAAEAVELKDLITTNFPAAAWIIVAGDMNLFSDTEAAILTFTTFLSDSPIPADQNGDVDTNAGRNERYDRVLPSFSMTNTLIPLVMPSRTYTNGLVFDSRIYTPLSEVPPVQTNDSGALNMQHMAVVKAFNIPYTITNFLSVPSFSLSIQLSNNLVTLSWPSNAFRLETSLGLTPPASWQTISNGISNSGPSRTFTFTNSPAATNQFFRLAFP